MIDNKVKTNFFERQRKNLWSIKNFELRNPRLFALCWEEGITNGLGYAPVRKSMQESKTHTQEGLMKHLANMDYLVLFGKNQKNHALASEHGSALIQLESQYRKCYDVLMESYDVLRQILQGYIEPFSEDINVFALGQKSLAQPTNPPEQKKELSKFLRRFGDVVGILK